MWIPSTSTKYALFLLSVIVYLFVWDIYSFQIVIERDGPITLRIPAALRCGKNEKEGAECETAVKVTVTSGTGEVAVQLVNYEKWYSTATTVYPTGNVVHSAVV